MYLCVSALSDTQCVPGHSCLSDDSYQDIFCRRQLHNLLPRVQRRCRFISAVSFQQAAGIAAPGFIIEPPQAIKSRDPCGISDPDGSGYEGLKILDWDTESSDAAGTGICGWYCYDCPEQECEKNQPALPLGGEADWCCCGSRRACNGDSVAQYVILNLAGNDLLQLFKFYGGEIDLVVAEAKSMTNYVTSQGRAAIWLNLYPIACGSLGGVETSCSRFTSVPIRNKLERRVLLRAVHALDRKSTRLPD